MAQFARPDSDVTNQGTGGFADIDESSPSDTDYWWGDDSSTDVLEVGLSNVTDPGIHTGHTVRVRLAKVDGGVFPGTGGNALTQTVLLLQGGTTIATIVSAVTAPDAWTTTTVTISEAEAGNITDYSDLRIRVTQTASGGSPANRRGGAVSWAELEVPDFAPATQDIAPGFIDQTAIASAPSLANAGTVLEDYFNRSVTGGWGTSTSGFAYTLAVPSRGDVNGSVGLVNTNVTSEPLVITNFPVPEIGRVVLDIRLPLSFTETAQISLAFFEEGQDAIWYSDLDIDPDFDTTIVSSSGTANPGVFDPETWLRYEVVAVAGGLRARAWEVGLEPPDWQVNAPTVSSGPASFHFGIGANYTIAADNLIVSNSSEIGVWVPLINQTATTFDPTVAGGAGGQAVTLGLIDRTAQIHVPEVVPNYAIDDYGRTVNDGWGAADTGGSYTIKEGAANEFDVASGRGTVIVGGVFQGKQIALDGISARDVDLKIKGQSNKLATGTDAYVAFWHHARRISGQDTRYLGYFRALTDGTPQVRISRVLTGSNLELVTWTTVPGTYAADTDWRLRFRVTGASPTTLKLKAWPDGSPEPDWQISTTDSTAALQTVGAVGIQAFNSPGITNNPVIFSFDEFRTLAGPEVELGVIDQTAQIHEPVVATGGGLQAVTLDQIAQTAATFDPTVTAAAGIAADLIDQAATIHAPVVAGLNAISVDLIGQAATINAPAITTANSIAVAQITQTATAHEPTVESGAAGVSAGLINQTAATFTPTITTGVVSVSPEFIDQAATASAPAVTTANAVDVARIDQAAASFAPSISLDIPLNLIDRTAQIHAPTTTATYTVAVDQINQTATISAPILTSLATIALGLIDQTPITHEPVVDSGQTFIVLGQINQAATADAPTVTTGAAPLSVGLIDQTAQPRTPTITAANSIDLELVTQAATAFAPAISQLSGVQLDQIDQAAQAFAPTVSAGAVTVDVGLIDQSAIAFATAVTSSANVSLELINQAVITYDLAISTTGAQNVALELINSSAVAYGISVSGGTVQGNRPGRWFGYGNPPYEPPSDHDQRLTLATIRAGTRAFSPSVEASDDEVVLGLSEDDLLVLA